MKNLCIALVLVVSGSAMADQSVIIQGAVVNTVNGSLQPDGCTPSLAITGIDQASQKLVQLCSTNDNLSKAKFTNGATASDVMQGSTFFFKGTIIGKGEVLAVEEVTGAINPTQKCSPDAAKFLAKKYKLNLSSISFSNAALVGDAADAVEIDMFNVANRPGLYKVELNGEMCSLRSITLVNN